jgi:anti-sigma regulatory factor (Ser/Thr protein kinase)
MTGGSSQISVRSGPAALESLQRFCRSRLEPLDRNDLLLTTDLVIEEVVLNIIRHGYGDEPGPIDLTVEVQGDEIALTIRDNSPAFDPLQVEQPELQLMEGKRGLPLLHQIASSTRYEYSDDGWNVLTVTLQIPDETVPGGSSGR